jgi:hypothetical protein
LPNIVELTEDEITRRNQIVRDSMTRVEPPPKQGGKEGDVLEAEPPAETAKMGNLHQMFHRVDHLTGPAKAFYEEVAELSSIPLKDLTRAVYGLEMLLVSSQKNKN